MQAYAVRWNHWRKPETELSHWQPAATAERGVVHREPGRTAPGWRLYATAIRTRARLIGPEGTVAHRWELPFSEAWPHPEHVSQPVADRFIRWGAVHVFDDGSLLVNYETMFDFPFSYGMVKMNRHSEPIWRFEGRSHHNFEVTADGRIWTLTQNVRQVGDGRLPGSTQPVVVADGLVELSSDGEVQRRLSLVDILLRSSRRSRLAQWRADPGRWDYLHANDVEELGPSFAAHHDWARAGDVMVSLRALSALVVVDPDDATVEWMSRGPWLRQHDPDPLANGHLLVFDNLGHGGEAGSSRIVEWAPDDGRIVWSYTGSADRPFLCPWGGGQQLLPNGHVLVGDTASGRMFEVDRRGERVWQFENPVRTRSPDGREFVATLTRRIQYVEPGSLSFLDAP